MSRRVLIVLFGALLASMSVSGTGIAQSTTKDCSIESVRGLVALTDLGSGTYQGEQGGLFPGGSNLPPESHLETGLALSQLVVPLDSSGHRSDDGVIVMMSVGVSNTMMYFDEFRELARSSPDVNPRLVMVNGAVSGHPLDLWLDENGFPLAERVPEQLARAGVTAEQVQVVWVFVPDRDFDLLPFPEWAEGYASGIEELMRTLPRHLPNLKLAYLSSSEYRGNAPGYWAEEPIAYEEGFAIKWAIESQIQRDPSLSPDFSGGTIRAPWMTWGPYLWANGTRPRDDGLVWLCEDFRDDGVHPIGSGRRKGAELLMTHFSTDPSATSWFLGDGTAPLTRGEVVPAPLPPITPERSERDVAGQKTTPLRTGRVVLAGVVGALTGALAAWGVSLLELRRAR